MKVQVAIAMKMLICAWHILKDGVSYKDVQQHNRSIRNKWMTRYTSHGKATIFVMACDLALQINQRHEWRWNPV